MSYLLRILFFLFVLVPIANAQVIEKTHLTTDRSIYAPEDTVWFKAYVFDASNMPSDQSISLKLFMLSTAGEKIIDRSIPVFDGTSSGFFVAPKLEGKYNILAISGKMIGSPNDQIFSKEILVREALVDEFELRAYQNIIPQKRGEAFSFDVYTTSGEKRLPKTNFTYELWSDKERVERGREKTDENGKSSVSIKNFDWGKELYLHIKSNEGSGDRDIQYTLPIEAEQPKVDLQFFPEGGEMILGQDNKVAFKASTSDGSAFSFKGLLLDGEGRFMDSIASFYQGMGSFTITPSLQDYAVKVIGLPDTLYTLPMPKPEGIAISLSRKEGIGHMLKILPSPAMVGSSVSVELSQFDNVSASKKVVLLARQFFELPTESLSPGLARVTIYSDQGEPLAERLVFTGSRVDLNFKVETDQQDYSAREKVKATIVASDKDGTPVKASFSIAVIDKDRTFGTMDGQPNLMANILLTSELRGTVPTPNFYFTDDPRAEKALDLVTLTHGWRRFVPTILNDPEGISGTVLNNNSKRKMAIGKPMSIIAFKGYTPLKIATNEEGLFQVPSLYLKNKGDSFLITAPTEGPKDRFSVMLDESASKTAMTLFKNTADKFAWQHPYGNIELFLKEYKLPKDRFNSILMLNSVVVIGNRQQDSECELRDYHFQEPWVTKMADEIDMTTGEISGWIMQVSDKVKGYGDVMFQGKRSYTTLGEDALLSTFKPLGVFSPFRVFLNCYEIPYIKKARPSPMDLQIKKTFETIDFSNLESISVRESHPRGDMPIVRINTKDDKIIYKPVFRKHRFLTLYTNYDREFYSPIYDTPEKTKSPVPDLRETIFWQASVQTDEEGKVTIEFYNADRPNSMQISIEGVDVYGRVGAGNFIYKVKEDR
ncbi:hypothetical protein [Roseivirga echinicomitans]|uniref:Macroglobulin domain-containing protein n=1 Tax=Roseivirga echinicomitans TaxID=296218 RepID=A0A150X0X4_9BACT|nr:hypothetical protein [Roseivirga echinicomitans]KYG72384.1 hypothetical protein AWN68_11505 [Roseivirga echinicomitans]